MRWALHATIVIVASAVVLITVDYRPSGAVADRTEPAVVGTAGTAEEQLVATAADIILLAANAQVAGAWRIVADGGAAAGKAAVLPNAGRAKVLSPVASPADYFTLAFDAAANTSYHIWVRGRADGNSASNDSVHIQFSESVDASGRPIWGNSVAINLEDCSGCGNSGWGWEDNGWGSVGALGPHLKFAVTGRKTLRVQNREDGFFIDQIVLSPSTYLTTSPGANKNDSTFLASPPPPTSTVTLVRQPYLQQVTDRSAVIVWASREKGVGTVRINGRTVTAQTRLVPATTTLLTTDYYQHEATVTGLAAVTTYPYEVWVGSVRAAANSFKTAPAPGTGSVKFMAFGDSGTGVTIQKTLASRIAADTWDLALHTGDVAYGVSTTGGDATYKTYHAWFFDIYRDWLARRPFYPAMGNHDGRQSNAYGKAYLDLFVLPEETAASIHGDEERYYSFDYGPVHFVVLDTERAFMDLTRRPTQLQWLESDLSSSPLPWKIAVFHKPPYSSGTVHGSELTVRQAFGPLFEKYGVQMVITGHDHAFERSVPWRASTDRTKQAVTYIVTGGAGAKLYSVRISPWTARSISKNHYMRVNVSGCVLSHEAVGADGVVFDRFTLDRCLQASDAGSPTVRITSPSGGASLSGTVTVNISATDDTRVEKVDLFVDGVLVGLDRSYPYAVSWNSRTVAAGSHVLEARAYDLAGNRVSSAKVSVSTTGL